MPETYGWDGDHWIAAEPEDLLHLSNKELKAKASRSRAAIIVGICKWHKPLSIKQRWRLAAWIADMENRRAYHLLERRQNKQGR